MRAGLSTIQQTLTPDAAAVLNHSIAEASRRNHGQTTPLHVAATLLASPTGFLRQACIKSHPNSSHPLQCRALELCFSVALERLPTAAGGGGGGGGGGGVVEPPISNALMAALKRAQAHQRRGCPEQQQQPLLAVKVELEQLIISILDDPSVSRVMREASFSSPAVKATIEQSLTVASANVVPPVVAPVGLRSGVYSNPRIQSGGGGGGGGDEVKKVVEILRRGRKRNPVLVGDSEPEAVVKEVLRRIEGREVGDGAEVVNFDAAAAGRVREIAAAVEASAAVASGVVVNLGDLKWLVEQPVSGQQVVSEAGREAVAEIGRLLARFGDRVWLIGTATCETYLRCQVYHPTMETDWDLQAVPIAAKAPVPGLFPRLGGTNGILGSSVDSLSPMKAYAAAKLGPPARLLQNSDPSRKTNCCPQCSKSYEQELAKLVAEESEKSSAEVKQEGNRPPLPLWLQNAKARDSDQSKEQEMVLKQKTQELQKKWSDTCSKLHPSFHHPHSFGSERLTLTPKTISLPGLCNPNLLNRPSFQPKLQMNKSLGGSLQLNTNPVQLNTKPTKLTISPPGSPVRTDLVLGQDQTHKDRIKDLNNTIEVQRDDKMASKLDADSFKRLSKGLAEKVWWQPEAAVSVAATMTECRLDSTKQRRGAASKGDMWVLFIGPDRVGKRKMASALADLVSGSSPVVISLGMRRSDGDLDTSFRGKTVVDRIVEAVRRNPYSVIVLEDVNEVDTLMKGNIKRAMERGRITDSHGREISLGNVVFVLTADWLPENLRKGGVGLDEDKLRRVARRPWHLRLAVNAKTAKRRAHWLFPDDRTATKPRKEFDLNEAADGSHNTSDDSTIDHVDGNDAMRQLAGAPPPPREILEGVDDTIVFKQAESVNLKNGITSTISNRFSNVVGVGVTLEMDEDALEKIMSGLWLGRTSLEEWTESVLVPSFEHIKSTLPGAEGADESVVVRLESDAESGLERHEDLLPRSVRVVLTDA